MNDLRIRIIGMVAAAALPLAGCHAPPTVYLEAKQLPDNPPPLIKEVPVPVAVPQWRRLPATRLVSDTSPPTTQQVIEDATRFATQRPTRDGFIEAVQTYDYVPGMVYQVIASPGHVTTVQLRAGEQLLAKVCGDTAQWMVGDTHSGSGDETRTLVLVKPVKPDIYTNLVISTSERVYQIDLQSVSSVYQSAVQWTYPADFAHQLADAQRQQIHAAQAVIEPAVKLSDLDFGYRIHSKAKALDWMPRRVFSDGHKTYIAFPNDLDAKEAPPLFVLGRRGEAQLVNYRVRRNYYIVDQVIRQAELRLGESPQQIVTIERTGG